MKPKKYSTKKVSILGLLAGLTGSIIVSGLPERIPFIVTLMICALAGLIIGYLGDKIFEHFSK